MKSWKITDEDWRNRERWQGLRACTVNDMVEHTSTRQAPWVLVEAECHHARVLRARTRLRASRNAVSKRAARRQQDFGRLRRPARTPGARPLKKAARREAAGYDPCRSSDQSSPPRMPSSYPAGS